MMKKRIWKYPLAPKDCQAVVVPKGADFLSVIAQYDVPTMYFEVDAEEQDIETIVVYTIGTGHPIPPECYCGTVSTMDGRLIWHIFAEHIRKR